MSDDWCFTGQEISHSLRKMKRKEITGLTYDYAGVSKKEMIDITENLGTNTNIRSLNFCLSYASFDRSGDDVFYLFPKLFEKNETIRSLHLCGVVMNEEKIKTLFSSFKHQKCCLESLDISYSKGKDLDEAVRMGNVISDHIRSNHKYPTTLHVRGIPIDSIISSLVENNTLVEFGGSKADSSSVYKLLRAISFNGPNKTLRSLSLASIAFSTNDEIEFFGKSILHSQLVELELCNSPDLSEKMVHFIKPLIEHNNDVILETLVLSSNKLCDPDVSSIVALLKVNKSLKYLDVHYNSFSIEGLRSILSSLQINNTLQYFNGKGCSLPLFEFGEFLKANDSINQIEIDISSKHDLTDLEVVKSDIHSNNFTLCGKYSWECWAGKMLVDSSLFERNNKMILDIYLKPFLDYEDVKFLSRRQFGMLQALPYEKTFIKNNIESAKENFKEVILLAVLKFGFGVSSHPDDVLNFICHRISKYLSLEDLYCYGDVAKDHKYSTKGWEMKNYTPENVWLVDMADVY